VPHLTQQRAGQVRSVVSTPQIILALTKYFANFEEKIRPMSTVRLLTHIVFATKNREMTISEEHCEDLYRFITSFLKKNKCYLKRINGIANHIHLLAEIHPTLSVALLVQHLKHDSSLWAYQSHYYPNWDGWCEGYFACSVSPRAQDAVIEYIKNQKVHHSIKAFDDEYVSLLKNAGVEFQGYLLG
jgi:REP element-mobilizing transposase RayT